MLVKYPQSTLNVVFFRLVDTAAAYKNESDIGKAIKELGIKRQDLFITSKLTTSDQGKDKAPAAIEKSLKDLGTDYLDLYLIHWPGASGIKPEDKRNAELRRQSWDVLVEYQKKGVLKSIGVSNYLVPHLEDLMEHSNIVPQVRMGKISCFRTSIYSEKINPFW